MQDKLVNLLGKRLMFIPGVKVLLIDDEEPYAEAIIDGVEYAVDLTIDHDGEFVVEAVRPLE
ncbi:hypothetical protein phiFa_481 [Thermus phage phiFa]|nr:hypothetical protein phiFa_48 [Thermus phage phiFa]QKE11350.1 hypothetical protein phiFa_481 [Thermus phage phiFa]